MEDRLTDTSAQERCRRAFWGLVALTTLVRLLFAGRFGLSVDESHYVLFSRHLAWGYFDHPPMVAFLAAATAWLGHGVFWVRLGPIVCSALSLALLRGLALALYRDERVALGALALMLLMPASHLISVALLPDATLNLFWCAALLAAWRAMDTGRWRWWILTGIAFGGALLSKYHGVLLPVCLFCFVVLSPRHRVWLRRPHPYVAGLIGLAVFLPNVLWNAHHDWISYAYQMAHGRGGGFFSLAKLGKTLGGQLAAASPLIFGLLVAACVAVLRDRPTREADRFAACMSVPVFLFFCAIGLTGKILPHWPYVGWWAGSLLVVTFLLRRLDGEPRAARRWRRWAVAAGAVAAAMLAGLYAAITTPVVEPLYAGARRLTLRLHERWPSVQPLAPFSASDDITNDLYGWEVVAREAERIRAAMPSPATTFVFCHRFYMTSQIGVYLAPGTAATVLDRRPNQYRLWFDPMRHRGWDALFIDNADDPEGVERYAGLFERTHPSPELIVVERRGTVAHRLQVYRCYGFKGAFEESDD